ncbi:MAG: DUF421 domain-containing protein [Paracoccaceae bacterium]
MAQDILFDGFDDLVRAAVSVPLIYFFVILAIRLSGKRSTSQMNNFDWVVTVAMGSIAGSAIILKNVTVIETALSIALLLSLQYCITRAILRFPSVGAIIKAEPALLLHDGRFLEDALERSRVTKAEVRAAIREQGLTAITDVRMVILENDATFSVIPFSEKARDTSALSDVPGYPPRNAQEDQDTSTR